MKKNKKLGLAEVVSIAVGTMIGASIFSIFGVGAQVAGKNLPEAFLLSGLYASMVAYSYAKMGRKVTSNAGPIAFVLKGIGDNLLTGALSLLIWLTYVVSISMFAKGFAGYFLDLLNLPLTKLAYGITEIALVAFFTGLNFFGSKAVGKTEFFIVLTKLSILLLFIIGGLWTLQPGNLSPTFDTSGLKGTLFASVIFFLSYMGFGLIVNASENMKNPRKNVPRAIFISIGIAMLVYIGVSVAAIGNLPVAQIVKAKENALAQAAMPFLGQFGFLLLSIGALFSISSALNATLYGGANISYSLAKDGELPEFFERKLWFKSIEGLYITAGLSIVVVLLFNIEQIAAITSSIFSIIYIFVIFSHYKIAREVGGSRILIMINFILMIVLFAALIYYQFENETPSFYATLIALGFSIIFEVIFRHIRKRKFDKKKNLRESNSDSSAGKNANS